MHVRHGSEKQVHRFPGLPEAFATIRPSSRSLSKKTKESYTLGNHWRHTRERFVAFFETGCPSPIPDSVHHNFGVQLSGHCVGRS